MSSRNETTIEIKRNGSCWDWLLWDKNGYAIAGNEGYRSEAAAHKDAIKAQKEHQQGEVKSE